MFPHKVKGPLSHPLKRLRTRSVPQPHHFHLKSLFLREGFVSKRALIGEIPFKSVSPPKHTQFKPFHPTDSTPNRLAEEHLQKNRQSRVECPYPARGKGDHYKDHSAQAQSKCSNYLHPFSPVSHLHLHF